MKWFLKFGAAGLLLCGCQPKQVEGGKEIAQEVEQHKVKRITQEQIFAEAFIAGDTIVKAARELLQAQVAQALEQEGVAGAMKYCRPESYPALKPLLSHYDATLSRSSQKLRNPANRATGKAAGLLDAYHYNSENKLPLEPNVQQSGPDEYIFTQAIVINNQMCLRCHGKPGSDIAAADLAAIKAKYPTDEAIGYHEGDLRGMWQVNFTKAGLVRSLSEKLPKRKRRRL